ncbi:MAG: GNAT family N-acetyltransferase [Opitutaceae bacterium]|jgi:GNAT superfamily N-acetyltransferase
MCQNSTNCGQHNHAASPSACTCGGQGRAHGDFHLRPATIADIPALIALIGELATFEGLQHECEVNAPLLAKNLFGETATARAIIAHQGATAAGFAVWYPTLSTFLGQPGAFLEDLYVRPPFRKRGLGRQLLLSAARQSRTAGCARLEWRALKWNTDALAFYKTLGAEVLSEWLTLRLDATGLDALPSATAGS